MPVRGILVSTPRYIDSEEGRSSSCSFINLWLEESKQCRTKPQSLTSEIHPNFLKALDYRPGQKFLALLPGSYIVAAEGVVLTGDHKILNDISYEMAKPIYDHSYLTRCLLPPVRRITGRVFVLTNQGYSNYYHWLFDVLPKLALLEAAGEHPDAFCSVTTQGFQQDSLEMLGIPLSKIYALNSRSHFLPDVVMAASPPGRDGEISSFTCAFLRDRLAGSLLSLKGERQRIVIVRDTPGQRSWLNFPDCKPMLLDLNFIFIKLERLSLSAQISLFASAEVVVAPHGAGLSNIVFCPKDTLILELFSPRYINTCYWKLACACGLSYSYLIGQCDRDSATSDPHRISADISVSIASLKRILSLMGIKA